MRIGLVVPNAGSVVQPEGPLMYPDVTFVAEGTGVGSMTMEGYEQAVDKIVPAAEKLAAQGVEAISLFGASFTFYRGPQFNEDIQEEIRRRTGLPVSSMSSAMIEGLRAVGAKRVAVATAYSKVVDDKLRELVEFYGFEVDSLESFGITEFGAAGRKTEAEIVELVDEAREKAPKADSILISCGGLRTLGISKPLEDKHGLPVVSSTPAGFWSVVRLAGHSGRVANCGRLLEDA
jgi:arylmalonate decarboxylase